MLYQLGVLRIRVAPFNVDTVDRTMSNDFVAKPVVGARPPREYVGLGDDAFTLSGSLFPKVIGGLTELEMLKGMLKSGNPQFLLRGDGVPFGWFTIERLKIGETELAEDGVGQIAKFSVELHAAPAPSRVSLFSVLLGLFT